MRECGIALKWLIIKNIVHVWGGGLKRELHSFLTFLLLCHNTMTREIYEREHLN